MGIVLARAAVLTERQAQTSSSSVEDNAATAAPSKEGDGQDAMGFAVGDSEGAETYFLGIPKGAAWHNYTAKWPWSADMLQAVVAWAASRRWMTGAPPMAQNTRGDLELQTALRYKAGISQVAAWH